jgi:lysophospholipase L1-like esterase
VQIRTPPFTCRWPLIGALVIIASACSGSGGATPAADAPSTTAPTTPLTTAPAAPPTTPPTPPTSPGPLPAPTLSLKAIPANILLGASATLTWTTINATACGASGAWSGAQATAGTTTVAPASAGTFTYALNCTGSGGSAAASSTLIVTAPPQPVIAASPASLNFPSQTVGTTSAAQAVSLSNTGTGALSGIAVSITGDFVQSNNCGTTLVAAGKCTITVAFTPSAAGARTGTLTIASYYAGGAVTVSLSGTGAAPASSSAMALISRGLPMSASSAANPATYANDADYNTEWRSIGVPATLTLDLSSVPAAQRQSIWLVWYNDDTYGYDHALINQVGYNNAGAYTIEGNVAAGGGAAPAAGWVQLASLAGNTLHSYSHLLPFAGYNWVRLNFTASDGSPGNSDIAVNLDAYGASNGVTDGWFFNGDSISANCMGHDDVDAQDENNPSTNIVINAPSFGQQVDAIVGNDAPLQENAGMPGYTSGDMVAYLAGWLQHVPSKYVTINLGTNDAAGAVAPSTFYSNMQQLAQAATAAGKVPIIPTIPYSRDPTHLANIPPLNAQIAALYKANPAIVPGPDLWSYFMKNPQYISTDNVHPNAQGCAAYRTLWSQFAVTTIYRH